MALHPYQVVNPTNAPITVGANTVAANDLDVIQLDDTLLDAYTFMAGGCALLRDDVGTVTQRQQSGFLVYTGEYHEA
jgi:hypothetical protein